MRAIQKIVRQGNSAMVTLPRQLMHALDWLPGELLQLEKTDDGALVMRAWKTTQVAQGQSPGVIVEPPAAVRP